MLGPLPTPNSDVGGAGQITSKRSSLMHNAARFWRRGLACKLSYLRALCQGSGCSFTLPVLSQRQLFHIVSPSKLAPKMRQECLK